MSEASIYNRVLAITEDYLGPAAPRFINRLVTNHLSKPASKITKEDIPQLVIWIKLATTVITDDELVVSDYLHRLEKLSIGAGASGKGGKSSHHATPA